MYRSRSLIVIAFCALTNSLAGQTARGRVVTDSVGNQSGLPGIEIFVPATGETVYTDSQGYFVFKTAGTGHMDLIARFSPKDSSVFMYHPPHVTFPVLIKTIEEMRLIDIKAKKGASSIHSSGVRKIEVLNEDEFKKAACCTLSESFETNNTIEVSNADGVSGIRQVEMLGLSGKYVLMTRNNMPVIRGLNVLTGLNHIPGPMVGGVHIAKGAGTVTTGFEGITGGLNYALKAEPKDPRFFLNGYVNSQARAEGNIVLRQKLNKQTFNHVYLHYGTQLQAFDKGKDGYSDLPLFKRIYFGDQFSFYGKKSEGQFGFSFVNESREGGDIRNFRDGKSDSLFHFKMNEDHLEAFAKIGIFLNEDGSSSIGNIFYATQTNSTATLNNLIGRTYAGQQRTVSYTGLYGSPDEKKWSTKSGINFVLDDVSETYKDSNVVKYDPSRQEFSAGVFSELVYKTDVIAAVFGGRVDWNNIYGILITPRFHLKYDITKKQQLHLQAGLGRRTPWVFAENLPYLISNRNLQIQSETLPGGGYGAYGLPQEMAWNAGASYTRHMELFKFPSTLTFDAYFTWFARQIVADRDQDPGVLIISNQSGNQTTLAQVDWMVRPHRRVELKLSYRYVNSQMLLAGAQRLQNMQAPHRGLLVVNYNTRSKWYLDLIGQLNSPKRLPITTMLPESQRMLVQSPWYALVHAQLRKEIRNWEFYTGGENLLNVLQKNPVLNVQNAGKEYFDAAFAWGPTMGTNFTFGFRYKFK